MQDGRCLAVAFSPDGKLLATGSLDRTIRVWKCAEGTTAVAGRLRDVMHDVCFLRPVTESPPLTAAARFACGNFRGTSDRGRRPIRGKFLNFRRPVRQESCPLAAAHGADYRLVPDPVRNALASAGNDGTVSLTDTRTGAEGPRVDLHVLPRVFQFNLQNNDELLCSDKRSQFENNGPGHHAWIYSLETGEREQFRDTIEDRLSGMTLTPDGKSLLLGHHHGKITIHTRQVPHTFETWDLHWDPYPKGHPEQKTTIDQLEFAPDGRTLIVRIGDSAGSLRLYDYWMQTARSISNSDGRRTRRALTLRRWLAGKLGRVGSLWDCGRRLSPAPRSVRQTRFSRWQSRR